LIRHRKVPAPKLSETKSSAQKLQCWKDLLWKWCKIIDKRTFDFMVLQCMVLFLLSANVHSIVLLMVVF